MEKEFHLIKKRPEKFGGSMICKVEATTKDTFSFFEHKYGEYVDLMKDFLFIDDKTNWEWFLESKNMQFRVYDFKGGVSIGSVDSDVVSSKNKVLIQEANRLKKFIEDGVEELKLKHREDTDNSIKENKFPNFVNTFEPAISLLLRANKDGFLLEGLMISVSIVDAILRQCIMFCKQIEEKTSEIFEEYIFQEENGSYFYESDILKEALARNIIDEDFYKKLDKLYKERNKAVHRYFITTFQYEDIAKILNENIDTLSKLRKILYDIEEKQIETGYGVTIPSNKNEKVQKDDPLLRISSEEVRKKGIKSPKRQSMFGVEWGKDID